MLSSSMQLLRSIQPCKTEAKPAVLTASSVISDTGQIAPTKVNEPPTASGKANRDKPAWSIERGAPRMVGFSAPPVRLCGQDGERTRHSKPRQLEQIRNEYRSIENAKKSDKSQKMRYGFSAA
jgi:hypothetical protein